MGECRIDGHLGDVSLQSMVVIAAGVFRQRASLHFHLVRCLEGSGDHLADTTHRLGVTGND